MEKIVDLGVDAGNISFVDKDYILANNGMIGDTAKRECKEYEIGPGEYKINIEMPDTWNGKISEEFTISIPSGTLCVGDMCYFFSSDEVDHNVWLDYLNRTNHMEKQEEERVTCRTGGDGEFSVSFGITKV
jgi:hypothetical protein